MTRRQKRDYTEEFKLQMVQLFRNGKTRKELIDEYELTPPTLAKWINYHNKSGSFKEVDNLSDDQKEIIKLQKSLKQANIEIDILKQAALIMGRK